VILTLTPRVALASTPTTTTLDVPAGTQYGPFTVTGHVRPAPGSVGGYIPSVSFYVDGSFASPAPLDDNGDGSTELSLSPGTHSIYASFGPWGDWDASQSAPASVLVKIGTQVQLSSTRNPALTSQSVTITAAVSPSTITGGTLSIVDAFDGSTLATGAVGGGGTSVSVTRTFAVGSHVLTATYTGDGDYGPSEGHLTQTVNADTSVDAGNLRVDYATFYPYRDGYRDSDNVRGTLRESASVVISIYSPAGTRIRLVNLGTRAPGSYVFVWTGRNSSGAILPAGVYSIRQRLTDVVGNVRTVTHSVTLSTKRLIWTSAAITRYGSQYSAYSDAGNGYISTSRSAYYRGVRLSSGTAGVAVRYSFAVRAALVYSSTLTFRVLGRSPTGTPVVEGLWNRAYCSTAYIYVGCYDVKAMGPGYAWWAVSGSSGLHLSGRTGYGLVAVPYNGGVRTFDVAKVQLVYRWAVLG
jgi:Big-like domain-containing protein/flagellar hook capping protein FlgD